MSGSTRIVCNYDGKSNKFVFKTESGELITGVVGASIESHVNLDCSLIKLEIIVPKLVAEPID